MWPSLNFPSPDNPTPKFGEVLRSQVEERLNFFETGTPPSKNTDAMRKALESIALDADEDEDAMDEDAPSPVKKEKKEKKDKKKRKSDAMDVDVPGEHPESSPEKKVKLSKEEKKALKKAAKKAQESGVRVTVFFCGLRFACADMLCLPGC